MGKMKRVGGCRRKEGIIETSFYLSPPPTFISLFFSYQNKSYFRKIREFDENVRIKFLAIKLPAFNEIILCLFNVMQLTKKISTILSAHEGRRVVMLLL